jgi:hypothetical protein
MRQFSLGEAHRQTVLSLVVKQPVELPTPGIYLPFDGSASAF